MYIMLLEDAFASSGLCWVKHELGFIWKSKGGGGNLITLPFGYGKHYIALCGAALGAEHFVRILSGSSLAFVPTV